MLALVAVTPLLWGFNPFVRRNPDVRAGTQAYEAKDYDGALKAFEHAEQEVGARPEVHLGKGAALYQLGRTDEAAQEFQDALSASDPTVKARSYHDLGNAQLKGGKASEAIESYQKALMLDPSLHETKVNLELARAMLAEQRKQPQDQQGDKKKDDPSEKKQDQKKNDQKQSQDEDQSPQDSQQAKNDASDKTPPEPKGGQDQSPKDKDKDAARRPEPSPKDESAPEESRQAQAREGEMSREEAERLLDSLENRDVNLLHWNQMVESQKRRGARAEKDW
ncbi:MAG: tetratricopeptide repeat protein [Myxococcales bacterium]|nr:tetratricopeptide repeat protein [Myxococcales bacterium]